MEKSIFNTLCQGSKVHAIPQHAPPSRTKNCYQCGGRHSASVCHFKDAICLFCQKPRHIAWACLAKAKPLLEREAVDKLKPHISMHCIHMNREQEDVYMLFHVDERSKVPYLVELSVNEPPLCMEVDTGAAISLPNHRLPTHIFGRATCSLEVAVKNGNQEADLTLMVVKGPRSSL